VRITVDIKHSYIATTLVTQFLFLNLADAETRSMDTIVGNFSQSQLNGWEAKEFSGQTVYSFVKDRGRERYVLKAQALASASGLFNRTKIDLNKTPYLNWSWKVEKIFPKINESAQSGDDFPARIYVVVERGLMGFSSLSLNYVWASRNPVQNLWTSPYTDQVKLFAADSGSQKLGTWTRHKRNLREDLYKAFGEHIVEIHATALMTDTDNHGGNATAYYGNIWFSAD